MHESIFELLQSAGFQPDYKPDISREEILAIIGQYHGIIVRSKTKIDKELLENAIKLEFVARAGAGIDNIDYAEVSKREIKLVNAPEGNRDALGEHTVGMLLTLLHKLGTADREVKAGVWHREQNRGTELGGKVVGIYGFGFMGSAFAEKLKGFGCKVLVYDKYKTNLSDGFIEQVDLETFMEQTEVLSLHVPLTSETKGLFDTNYLLKFSKLSILLNTARGEILPIEALITLLKSQKLIGAGLDVLENEKIQELSADQQKMFDQLVAFDNVILTPHVAGWTYESYERINKVIVSKLREQGLAYAK